MKCRQAFDLESARPMCRAWLALVTAAVLASPAGAAPADDGGNAVPAAPTQVVLLTTLGNITLALEPERAPLTTANFLRYVDQKRLDGVTFYRAVTVGEEGRYGLIQGGPKGDPKRVLRPVAHESPAQTGLSHVDGAVSLARTDPGTATADFFIVVGDLKSLDGDPGAGDPGYAVFGRVIDGMDVVRQILAQPRDANAGAESGMQGQMLVKPVQIVQARRVVVDLPPDGKPEAAAKP
jgi:peptidyl-prolyl cis-trans isomerase A (cyclophilin A)